MTPEERELNHLTALLHRYRVSGAPAHDTKPLERHIQYLQEKIYGRHRQASQALYGRSPGVAPGGAGGPITLAQFARQFANPAFFAREEPYRAPEEAGIRAGEIVAWRCWKVRDGLLTSTYREVIVWRPGNIIAAHGDPAKERYAYGVVNHIGIFAWKELFDVTEYSTMLDPIDQLSRMMFGERSLEPTYAIGQVLLWGSVVEHEKGYRAQFAKVHKIMIGPKVQELRETYGVTGI